MRVRILVWLISLAVISFGVHKEALERYNQSPDMPTTQTNAVEATPDKRIQILHPQWDVAGKDGAITIITGFSEGGQRIVATTDGEGTCAVGMPEGEFDKNTHQFTGREFPNTNPIYLTIYSDGSGGQLEQLTRDGSTEICGASASFNGR
jgi:hypothetical protein